MSEPRGLRLDVGGGHVSALWDMPMNPIACLVLAPGAGAGLTQAFMAALATGLKERGVACLRYQFPYLERGSKRPDAPEVCHATVRVALAEARAGAPNVPLFAGGKSFGGRMTSQTLALDAAGSDVRGVVFFGFPLHPAGKPSVDRGKHLQSISVPMLFLQGSRDALAEPRLLEQALAPLGSLATAHVVHHADHSFHAPIKSGRTDAAVLDEILDAGVAWMQRII